MDHEHPAPELPAVGAPILDRAAFFDAHPEVPVSAGYLENMHDRMPGSAERTALMQMLEDESLRAGLTEPDPELGPYYTPKRLSVSALAFWKDVDDAVSAVYGDTSAMQRLSEEYTATHSMTEERNQALARLNEAMVPVYAKLRETGYSYYDIVN